MLDGLRFRWKLRSLRADKRKTRRIYDKELKKARLSKAKAEDIDSLHSVERHELDMLDDEISAVVSRRLLALAEDNLLPTPSFDAKGPDWIESEFTGRYRLSGPAMVELRTAIRKEQREQSDSMFRWLAALTGIIGATIGLVSLLVKML